MYGNIVRDYAVFDEVLGEVEIGLGGGGEGDFDFFVAEFDEHFKVVSFLVAVLGRKERMLVLCRVT